MWSNQILNESHYQSKQINKNLNRVALEISELSQIIFSKKYEEKNRFLKDMSMTFDKKSRALKRL